MTRMKERITKKGSTSTLPGALSVKQHFPIKIKMVNILVDDDYYNSL